MLTLRWLVRSLVRRPSTPLAVVSTLAITLGIAFAAFVVFDAVRFKSLPLPDPANTYVVFQATKPDPQGWVAPGNARDITTQTGITAAYAEAPSEGVLDLGGRPRHVRMSYAMGDPADVIGGTWLLGGWFTADAYDQASAPRIVVSEEIWRSELGARLNVLGESVLVDGERALLSGVLRLDPGLPGSSDVWLPFKVPAAYFDEYDFGMLRVTVRTRQGADPAAVLASLNTRGPGGGDGEWTLRAKPVRSALYERVRGPLSMFLALACVLFLLAATNVASAVLGRNARQRHTYIIMAAVGATRAEVLRLVIAEIATLLTVGLLAAVVVAGACLALFQQNWPPTLPPLYLTGLTWRSALFALLLTVGAGAVLAAPSLSLIRQDHGSVRIGDGGRVRGRLILIGAQAVGATLLTLAAIALARSYQRAASVETGLGTDAVLTYQLALPSFGYQTSQDAVVAIERLVDALSDDPRIASSGLSVDYPVTGMPWVENVWVPGEPAGSGRRVRFEVVTPGYFSTYSIPLLAGRVFAAGDDESSAPVAVVSAGLARKLFPRASAVGQHLIWGENDDGGEQLRIIGVVGSTRLALSEGEIDAVYRPLRQSHISGGVGAIRILDVPVGDTEAVVREIAKTVLPSAAVYNVAPLATVLDRHWAGLGAMRSLGGAFALAALMLTALGLWSVTQATAQLKEREMALRLAVGGRPLGVFARTVQGVVVALLLGVGIGSAVWVIAIGRVVVRVGGDPASVDGTTILLTIAACGLASIVAMVPTAMRLFKLPLVTILKQGP